ncbi:carotenoid biosynthesis protein [Terrimonas ferruginea]|uniref:carotenoid biosynthesis protein n=1 Tax=Terrimonas ferruginea TaxID=249 RepID=UPI0004083DA5|nr:carotenoid biosynthesis protein [Terrimonas ferruginea]
MLKNLSIYQKATAVAALFHVIGAVGMLFFPHEFFLTATPFNLLLMMGLLFWTQKPRNTGFWIFVLCCFVAGMTVEIVGVQTSALFGHYNYGWIMGIKVLGVPLMLGVNWFMVVYISAITTWRLLSGTAPLIKIIVTALLAVGYDWLMEPVAIRLGYWQWGGDGSVPVYNYITWFLVSMLLAAIFHWCKVSKDNKFGVNLLLIQLLFFLVLRIFLT